MVAVSVSCTDRSEVETDTFPDTTHLHVQLTIGSEDLASGEGFGYVVDALACPGGRVAVLDRIGGKVLIFDREGCPEREIGSRGSGPGELLEPFSMGLSADGLLFVSDVSGLHVFDWDSGEWLGMKQGLSRPMLLDLSGVDGCFLTGRRTEWDTSSGEPVGTISYARYDTTGARQMVYHTMEIVPDYSSGYYESLLDPFASYGDLSGRVFVAPAVSDSIIVLGYGPDGTELLDLRRGIAPVPRSDGEISDERAFYEWYFDQMGMGMEYEPSSNRRAVGGLGVDSLGRLWVHLCLDTIPVFEIYDSTGALVEVALAEELSGNQSLWSFGIGPHGMVGYCEDPVGSAQLVHVLGVAED